MSSIIALVGVVTIAVYLIGFALLVVFKPASAIHFMQLFAHSAKAHFTELLLRICAGSVLIVAAPQLAFGHAFELFGWILIATSLVLAVLPWRWHRSFTRKVIPPVLNHLRLYGVCSMLLGSFVAASLFIGSGASVFASF